MIDEKAIAKVLEEIPKVAMKSPYEPLYLEGVRRALNYVLKKSPNPIVVDQDSEMICAKCGTDLLKFVKDSNVKICLNCKDFSV